MTVGVTAFRDEGLPVQPFLVRLRPPSWGELPSGPFPNRWFVKLNAGPHRYFPVSVAANRKSQYLAADPNGDWVAYVVGPRARRRIGNSLNATYLARGFGAIST